MRSSGQLQCSTWVIAAALNQRRFSRVPPQHEQRLPHLGKGRLHGMDGTQGASYVLVDH